MTEAIAPETDTIQEWTGPPSSATTRKYRDYSQTALALRTRPGVWARLGDRTSPSAAYQFALGVRRGRPVAFTPGEFEGAFQGREVYVRYVGPGGSDSHVTPEFVEGHIESDVRDMPTEAAARIEANHARRVREMPDTTHLFEF